MRYLALNLPDPWGDNFCHPAIYEKSFEVTKIDTFFTVISKAYTGSGGHRNCTSLKQGAFLCGVHLLSTDLTCFA